MKFNENEWDNSKPSSHDLLIYAEYSAAENKAQQSNKKD